VPVNERRVQFGLAAGAVLVFARALTAGFVGYDDPDYVLGNEHVLSGLSVENVRWAFTTFHAANWHPLTWLTLMIDVQLFGKNAQWMHAANVLVHAANTVLVYRFVRRTFGKQPEAIWVAALFAVHPLHVESVAWISERKDMLCTLFGLLSLEAYVRWARDGVRHEGVAAFVWLALGLLAKPMLVTWPFVFLLLDRWALSRPLKVKEKLPFFVLVAAVSIATFLVQRAGGAAAAPTATGVGERLATVTWGYAWYLWKTVVPTGLAVFHPVAAAGGERLGALELFGAAAVLLAVSVAVWRSASTPLKLGWLWFLGTLVPVIGFVRIGSAQVAERYHYIPSIGLFVGAVFWLSAAIERAPRFRRLAIDGGVAALLGFAGLTVVQLGAWQTEEALFLQAIERHPNAALMHFDLASTYFLSGRGAEAVVHARRAVELQPEDIEARFKLGHMLVELGRPAEAEVELVELLRRRPDDIEARFKLGQAYMAQRWPAEAENAWREVVRRQPDHGRALHGLAILALMSREPVRALELARVAVQALRNDDAGPALLVLSDAQRANGQNDEARATLEEAIALAESKGNAKLAAELRTRRDKE
jgi:protein O-mannosyl-transferase